MYIADSADNGVVRKVAVSTGIITTIAGSGDVSGADGDGGQATSAIFNNLQGIALDAAGGRPLTLLSVTSCLLLSF